MDEAKTNYEKSLVILLRYHGNAHIQVRILWCRNGRCLYLIDGLVSCPSVVSKFIHSYVSKF